MFKFIQKTFFLVCFLVVSTISSNLHAIIRNVVFDIHDVLVEMDHSKASRSTPEDREKLVSSITQQLLQRYQVDLQTVNMTTLVPMVGEIVGSVLPGIAAEIIKDTPQKIEYDPDFNHLFFEWFKGHEPTEEEKLELSAQIFVVQLDQLHHLLESALSDKLGSLEAYLHVEISELKETLKNILINGALKKISEKIVFFVFDLNMHARIAQPIEQTKRLVERLCQMGYNLYIISDAAKGVMNFYRREKRLEQIFRYFPEDNIIISGEVGCKKPDQKIFDELKKKPVELSECVFLDDQEENITAARRAGMQGIVFDQNDFGHVLTELQGLGIPL